MADENEVDTPKTEIIEPRKRKPGRPPLESVKLSRQARQRLDTLAAENADEVWQCLIEGARAGDSGCLRIICNRLWPERRGATVTFSMPPIKTAQELAEAHEHFIAQASQGILTLEEANLITSMIERKGKALETVELAKQLAELKDQIATITGTGEASA